VAYREAHGQDLPPQGPRWVHVGSAYVYVDDSSRLAAEPAPDEETERAAVLAAELSAFEGDPSAAVAALESWVGRAEAATESAETLIEVARDLARVPDPATAAKYGERLAARMLRDYRESRFRDVVRVGRAALAVYLLTERWRGLLAALALIRESAERLGDVAEAVAAVDDLDVLAEAAGVAPGVAGSGQAGERAVEQAPTDAAGPADGIASSAAVHTGVALGVKVAAAVAGALVLAGAAVTGFVVGDGVWYGLGQQAEGRAAIIAFASRGDQPQPEPADPDRGYDLPEGTVDPDDTLEACDPLYLDTYVRIAGVKAEVPVLYSASVNERPFAQVPESWARPAEYVQLVSWLVGSGGLSSGEPLPAGDWEIVVRIGDEEVDRAAVSLKQSC
jgi:hypothetical protein